MHLLTLLIVIPLTPLNESPTRNRPNLRTNLSGNESKTAIKKSNRPSIASNSAFQRFHNSILNANNNSDNVSSSTKTQPRKLNLVNNGTIAFSRDENGSIQNDATVLHKAHKILQYVS